jgi:hypothetical protein
MARLDFDAEKPSAEAEAAPKPQSNPFGGFDDSDSDDRFSDEKREDEKQEAPAEEQTDSIARFNEVFEELCSLISLSHDVDLRLTKHELLHLIELMYQIRPYLKTDFYCDKMSAYLLMQVHLETETPPKSNMTNAKIDLRIETGEKQENESKTKKKGGFDMEEFVN